MEDMIDKGYFVVLPYEEVKHLTNLRISPVGVVPQRARRPRTIVDYSFHEVNQETIHLAPAEAMQFGRALERLITAIYYADEKEGPIYLLKVDLSDGFYRVQLNDQDMPTLGIALPHRTGEPPLIAFPLVLPMGWTESPPTFCAATETITDLANQYFGHWDPPPHPLEKTASTQPEAGDRRQVLYGAPPDFPDEMVRRVDKLPALKKGTAKGKRKLQYADVYVDDEIVAAQGTPAQLNRLRRVLLHINDLIFRPNDHDEADRREPVSLKKLKQGDACFATCHTVLGWMIDTLKQTLELPSHRRDRLHQILSEVEGRKRCTTNTMHRLLGELRSMSKAIPGCRGLFSQLQHALQQAQQGRVKLNRAAQDHIADFRHMANDIASRPTRLGEIVPQHPTYKGTVDAAKSGMGGVWLPDENHPSHPPFVWRQQFPRSVRREIVSTNNPKGKITNSDLELAGTIAHEAVLVNKLDCREITLGVGCDNIAAVAWRTKGSTTTTGPAAYLLREAGLQQRLHRYQSQCFYVPGPANHLADVASRRFDMTDEELLTYLDRIAPQTQPWILAILEPETNTKLICALQQKRPERPSASSVVGHKIQFGKRRGDPTAPVLESTTRTSLKSTTRFKSCKSSPSGSGTEDVHVVRNRSSLAKYEMTYYKYRRRSPNWVLPTQDSMPTERSTPDSDISFEACRKKTRLQCE